MKTVRIVIAVLIVALTAGAWLIQMGSLAGDNKAYSQAISEAESRVSEKLYQQAIQEYEKALSLKESEEVRQKWIAAYQLAYEDGVVSDRDYANALLERCDAHPKEAEYWERLIELYYANSSFRKAYDSLQKAERSGAKSERLTELSAVVRYSYTEKGKTYVSFTRSPDGYYTVFDGAKWGVLRPDGEWLHERIYFFASPVGTSHETVLTSSRDVRVVDEDSVVLGILDQACEQMRAPSGTVIPVCIDGTWSYYDYDTGELFLQGFEEASTFTNGIAAVKKNGKWQLIHEDGSAASEVLFDDIKLHSDGEYVCENVMIASLNGSYAICDGEGKTLNDFRCKDADCYFGDLIAYQSDDGKWGYVTKEGTVALEPTYDEAKSFSSGLGAVRSGEKWGFIDLNGATAIDFKYNDADYFSKEGIAMVSEMEDAYHIIKLRFPG